MLDSLVGNNKINMKLNDVITPHYAVRIFAIRTERGPNEFYVDVWDTYGNLLHFNTPVFIDATDHGWFIIDTGLTNPLFII